MKTRQQGIALLLVLWALAVLTMLLGALVIEVRQQARLALWERDHVRASLAAEAGVNLAVQALSEVNLNRRWIADGRTMTVEFDGAQLLINVRSERGKLDLNAASAQDFGRLLLALGVSPAQANAVAHALDQRRGTSQPPLRTLEELRQLTGMNGSLYQAVLAHVTVWSGEPNPDPAFTTPVLQRALALPRLSAVGADAGQIFSIRSQAQLPDGFNAVIDSTVLLSPIDTGVRPFKVVRYNE